MSFKSAEMRSITMGGRGSGSGSGSLWSYRTTDSLAFVASDDYFLPFTQILTPGDLIRVSMYTDMNTPAEAFVEGTLLRVVAASASSITTQDAASTGPPPGIQQAYTTDTQLTEDELNVYLTNTGATGPVTLTLPPGVVDLAFYASRQEDYPFRFMPFIGETFIDSTPGKALELLTLGDAAGYCYANSEWTKYDGSALTAFDI